MDVLTISKLPSVNGGIKSGLNPAAKTFTTHDGIVLPIKPVSLMASRALANDPTGKPAIPVKRVMYGDPSNPVWGEEAVPTDPIYLEALQAWQARNNDRMMVYICATGVDVEVPQAYRDQQAEFFPDRSPNEIKYFYVTSLLNAADTAELMAVLTGQTGPTEEGVQRAQADFQRDSGGATD